MATRPAECPRCECCDHDEPHHWMEDGSALTGYSCKHCPAIAVECYGCAGTGEAEWEDDRGLGIDRLCGYCDGAGLVEVVKITLAEVKRLRGRR